MTHLLENIKWTNEHSNQVFFFVLFFLLVNELHSFLNHKFTKAHALCDTSLELHNKHAPQHDVGEFPWGDSRCGPPM